MFSSKVITYWCFVSHLAFYPDAVLPFHILRGVFFLLHSAPRSRNLNRINATTGAPANTEGRFKRIFFCLFLFFLLLCRICLSSYFGKGLPTTHISSSSHRQGPRWTPEHTWTLKSLCPTNKSSVDIWRWALIPVSKSSIVIVHWELTRRIYSFHQQLRNICSPHLRHAHCIQVQLGVKQIITQTSLVCELELTRFCHKCTIMPKSCSSKRFWWFGRSNKR